MIKVLLVEDNREISSNIQEFFKEDIDLNAVYNGNDALFNLDNYSFDIVILDLMLPDISGMTLLNYISKKYLNTGIIILTAKGELEDKLKAFNLGANDYLTKPFFMEELKARIIAILKSMGKIKTASTITFKDMEINMKTKKVYIKDSLINLNEKLYKLLEYLVLNKNVLLFKEQIFDNICGYDSDASTEIIEVYISRLRKQLLKYGYDKYLITKRGMGYILDESVDA